MDVDINAVLAETSAQRNAALDEAAMLRAAVKQLNDELEELKSKQAES
jgi:hypothetical protein